MSDIKPTSSVEEKLDEVVRHLRRLDNRDRVRTAASILRSLVWCALAVGSVWYFAVHGTELMRMAAEQAAKAAAQYTSEQSQGLMEQLMQQTGRAPKK